MLWLARMTAQPTEEELLRAYVEAELRRLPGAESLLKWSPEVPLPQQYKFLALDTFEALYGGALGGGKSSALLMSACQYLDVPGFSALIMRKTYPDLSKPGALMDRAHSWWANTGAKWTEKERRWDFPSGARVVFGHCETDKDIYNYWGGEYQLVCIDELTQWNESPYKLILSRIRKPHSMDVPLRMRAATNPGQVGHDWVGARFVKPVQNERGELVPLSGPFIPALLTDNPHLSQEDYLENLKNLDETSYAQLVKGHWVRDSSTLVYPLKSELRVTQGRVQAARSGGWRGVLGIDLGAAEKKATTGYVIILWSLSSPQAIVARSYAQAGITPSSVADEVKEILKEWPEIDRVVMDEGAIGKAIGRELRTRHQLPIIPAEKQDRRGWIRMLKGAIERGDVLYGPEARGVYDEQEKLSWDEHGLDYLKGSVDHMTDALMYAWRWVQSWRAPRERPEPEPTEGTDEWWRREQSRMKEEALARVRDTEGSPWWSRY